MIGGWGKRIGQEVGNRAEGNGTMRKLQVLRQSVKQTD